MQRKSMMQTLAVTLAAVFALAPPALAEDIGESDATSPLVDRLLPDGMTREELVGLYGSLMAGQTNLRDCVAGEEMFDDVPFDEIVAARVACPEGTRRISGGGSFGPQEANGVLVLSQAHDPNGWSAIVRNDDSVPITVRSIAYCEQ